MKTIITIAVVLSALLFCAIPALAQDQTKDKFDFPVLAGPYLGQKPPGETPLRFKPEGFNRGQYAEPVFLFSSDDKKCFFTHSDGIYSTKLIKGKWTQSQNLGIYGRYTDFAPNISPNGKKIFYNSLDRPLPEGVEKHRVPIWMSERKKTGWTQPKYLGFGGMYATVSDDENIYFTIRKDGVDCLAMALVHESTTVLTLHRWAI